jgi:hypothetical protein
VLLCEPIELEVPAEGVCDSGVVEELLLLVLLPDWVVAPA